MLSRESSEDVGMVDVCRRRPETREVMRAADEPSPVLCTSARVTPVGANGGIWASDDTRGSRPSSAS